MASPRSRPRDRARGGELQAKLDAAPEDGSEKLSDKEREAIEEEIKQNNLQVEEAKKEFESDLSGQIDDLESLKEGQLLTESRYRDLRDNHGMVFRAGMGAEAVLDVVKNIDLDDKRMELQEEMRSTSGQRRKKAIKRLRVFEAFRKSGNKPGVDGPSRCCRFLPPELRPMVQLDGGRFATSDLNDLYRRVINRNNRLKRLIELQAPEIIVRNEKRMLQEAVDALIDNGRRGRAVSGSHNHKAEVAVGPAQGQAGALPPEPAGQAGGLQRALGDHRGPRPEAEPVRPSPADGPGALQTLRDEPPGDQGVRPHIRSAKRMAERVRPEVWDILEEVVKDRPVLLNRAPTLHRLGIQAFQPVLIDGSAIQVHPLVCNAFGGRLRRRPDGRARAPLQGGGTGGQEDDAEHLQHAVAQLRGPHRGPHPGHGPRLLLPDDGRRGSQGHGPPLLDLRGRAAGPRYGSGASAGQHTGPGAAQRERPELAGDHVGRIILNDVLPPEIEFRNEEMDKTVLKDITSECYRLFGNEGTSEVLDSIKELGFHYASKSGSPSPSTTSRYPARRRSSSGRRRGRPMCSNSSIWTA